MLHLILTTLKIVCVVLMYSSIPETRWLINNRNASLTFLKVGKSKTRALEDLVSGRGLPPAGLPVHCLTWAKAGRELWEDLFYKDTNPFRKGSALKI